MFERADDLNALTDDQLSEALRDASDAVNRADARRLAIAAAWDRRQAWRADGAYNGRCWMADRCVVSRPAAGSILRTAKVVATAPVIAEAVADGSLPVAKATALAAVVTPRTAQRFVDDQERLLRHARRLDVDGVAKLARWWQRNADQDGAEPRVPERELRVTKASDGTIHVRGVLDPEGGEEFKTVLDGITDQLWRAERAGTDDEQEAAPTHCGPRLRADALSEMARRATAADPNRTGARPLISVVIDPATLAGEADHPGFTEDGGTLDPEAVRRMACDADLTRMLLDTDGEVLDLGRIFRTATPAQWRFLRLRDNGCTFPGCDRPPGWSQAHHIIWWEKGGFTDVDNLTLLCSFHHHLVHDHGWTLERLNDGGLTFTSPTGRVLHRPPSPGPLPMRPPRPRVEPAVRAAIRRRLSELTARRAS